jgi:hypothetical protein
MLDVFSKVKNLPICPPSSPQKRDLLSISNQQKRWAFVPVALVARADEVIE